MYVCYGSMYIMYDLDEFCMSDSNPIITRVEIVPHFLT
jgi:hypothetical protein